MFRVSPLLAALRRPTAQLIPRCASATTASKPAAARHHDTPGFCGRSDPVRSARHNGNASRLVQKRRHGFLSRVKTQTGRKTLMRRRAKGRKRLSA
ncbi:hypothetical protein N0V88_001209 [Collariella sp. IMI 366227]|nr:hypothetical protein N0V88_001209 [Collariella sp. IMI 366227]